MSVRGRTLLSVWEQLNAGLGGRLSWSEREKKERTGYREYKVSVGISGELDEGEHPRQARDDADREGTREACERLEQNDK